MVALLSQQTLQTTVSMHNDCTVLHNQASHHQPKLCALGCAPCFNNDPHRVKLERCMTDCCSQLATSSTISRHQQLGTRCKTGVRSCQLQFVLRCTASYLRDSMVADAGDIVHKYVHRRFHGALNMMDVEGGGKRPHQPMVLQHACGNHDGCRNRRCSCCGATSISPLWHVARLYVSKQ